MPFITSIHESLPYIDSEPSPAQRAAAEALVAAERARVPDDPHHALLRPAYEPHYTECMQKELARVASNQASGAHNKDCIPLNGIDLSRYEAGDDDDDENEATKDIDAQRSAIRPAAINLTYLRARRAHLVLLDRYGKNAWLVGNWQAEAELRAAETALAQAKNDIDIVTLRRQRAQKAASGELQGLEATWRMGVGRVLETEAAAEELRQQTLEARRRLAEESSASSK